MADETDNWRMNVSEPSSEQNLLAPLRIGQHRLVRRLGDGGMGIVYEAVEDGSNRAVAIKLMRQAVMTAKQLRRFQRESTFLSRLAHPHVAQVFEAGTHAEGSLAIPYYTMELVRNAEIVTTYSTKQSLSREDRVRLMIHACDAVQHAHENGVVHRDIKPGNLLVGDDGVLKLIDLGISKALGDAGSKLTEGDRVLGTMRYMSPEQIKGGEPTTSSDIYSLGIVLYELLLGRIPYQTKNGQQHEVIAKITTAQVTPPTQIDRTLGLSWEAVILKSLQLDPSQRYASAAAFADDLQNLVDGRRVSAPTRSIAARAMSMIKRLIRAG